jgi:iron complex outermembrane receptor protein
VLVLINGKRLHTNALIHVNGSIGRGSSSVDLGTIPVRAIERIEVLRDGAAAQYGSDAIAGVINIVLKRIGYDNRVNTLLGVHKEGDGQTYQNDMFYSKALPYDGFINITTDVRYQNKTDRTPELARLGDPEVKGAKVMVNTEIPSANSDITYYAHALYNYRDSEAGAYYRDASSSRNLIAVYPDGFLPLINVKLHDRVLSVGAKGESENAIEWDISNTLGSNDFHYYVNNSLNHSMGTSTPTSFDSGGLTLFQNSVNFNAKKKFEKFTVALGAEFRFERFGIDAGDEPSYLNGSNSNTSGAQGFPGFRPENEVNANRKNYALYVDVDYAFNDQWRLATALLYEYYTDFGSTQDLKLALAYRANEQLLFRTSGSTGFRAPSLAQSHFTSTSTISSGGAPLTTKTIKPTDPIAQRFGAKALEAEESLHFTTGVVYSPNESTVVSADYFYTKIDDRIMLSGDINASGVPDVSKVRFFTNAINTITDGLDLRIQHKMSEALRFNIAYNYAKTKIDSINTVGTTATNFIVTDTERNRIKAGQPRSSWRFLTDYEESEYSVALGISRYGSFSDVVDDQVYNFGANWVTNLDIHYNVSNDVVLTVGAKNLFDRYPDEWGSTTSSTVGSSKTVPYSQYAPFGYNGAYYYVRLGVTF